MPLVSMMMAVILLLMDRSLKEVIISEYAWLAFDLSFGERMQPGVEFEMAAFGGCEIDLQAGFFIPVGGLLPNDVQNAVAINESVNFGDRQHAELFNHFEFLGHPLFFRPPDKQQVAVGYIILKAAKLLYDQFSGDKLRLAQFDGDGWPNTEPPQDCGHRSFPFFDLDGSVQNIGILPEGVFAQNAQHERRVLVGKRLLGPFGIAG